MEARQAASRSQASKGIPKTMLKTRKRANLSLSFPFLNGRAARPPARPPFTSTTTTITDWPCPLSDHHHTTTAPSPAIVRPSISNHHPPYPIRARVKNPAALALPCLPACLPACLSEPSLALRFALPPGAIFPLSPSPLTHQCHLPCQWPRASQNRKPKSPKSHYPD